MARHQINTTQKGYKSMIGCRKWNTKKLQKKDKTILKKQKQSTHTSMGEKGKYTNILKGKQR